MDNWIVPFGFGVLVGAVIFDQAWRYVRRLEARLDAMRAETPKGHQIMDKDGLVERVARALSIPEHHTGWRYLSEQDRGLYRMQADYAIREVGDDVIEALDLLVSVADTSKPESAIAITNASLVRAAIRPETPKGDHHG